MKKELSCFLVILSVFMLCKNVAAEKKNLPERYKKWLDEEVVYIISPLEKEVFLKLQTDRERNLFIKAFWNHRDPTSGSPENEFKKEHYRRINYANHFFGRSAPIQGWKTDRGRIYIILGEPNDVQRFEGKTTVYPSEVWFYQGKSSIGLPPGFHLVFFQEGGSGKYRLYSPLKDGPQALMTFYYGDPIDYLGAYRQLKELEPDLAEVSLTLIPGEQAVAAGRPSMSSDILLQRVEMAPVRNLKEKYAQKFLDYKDIVEVEYSTNYILNDSLITIVKDPCGIYFVHYAIEPQRLSVNMFENKYYTTLKLNGKISDIKGETVNQFEKNISLEFNEEEIKYVNKKPLSIHDMFPLIPGDFKMSVLVKNEVSKEFTSLERELFIPGTEEDIQMTSLLLGYRVEEKKPPQGRIRPFQLGSYHVYFQANKVFLRGDNLVVAFQINSLNQALRQKGEIKYTFMKAGKEFRSITEKINSYTNLPDVVESFSLNDFLPAHYVLRVSLFLDGQEILFERDEFDVTHLGTIPRPWVYSKLLPATNDPVYDYLIGSQLYNCGKKEEARVRLEEAYRKKPDSLDFSLSLARVYMSLAEYQKIGPILLPFLEASEPAKFEVYLILGRAYQNLGKFSETIDVLDKAISHYGINTNVLNAIGECYFKLEELEEALAAWEKSLEINSNQPQIKKNIEAIKEKK